MLKFAVTTTVLLAAGTAGAVPVQWAPEDGGNGHYYELLDGGDVTYSVAEAAARSSTFRGSQGHLVTLVSQAEQNFVRTLIDQDDPSEHVWMALSDRAEEGVWRWIDGPETGDVVWTEADGATGFAPWNNGEPNDYTGNGGEDYGEAFFRGQNAWNDANESDVNKVIVEYSDPTPVPLPAGGALMLAAMGAFAGLRRRS